LGITLSEGDESGTDRVGGGDDPDRPISHRFSGTPHGGLIPARGGFMCPSVCRSLRVGIVVASAFAGGLLPAKGSFGRPTDDPFAEEPTKSPASRDPLEIRIQHGRELFLKRSKSADVANVTGDGLGPVFNGRSCVECHNMSRPGGAGAAE